METMLWSANVVLYGGNIVSGGILRKERHRKRWQSSTELLRGSLVMTALRPTSTSKVQTGPDWVQIVPCNAAKSGYVADLMINISMLMKQSESSVETFEQPPSSCQTVHSHVTDSCVSLYW